MKSVMLYRVAARSWMTDASIQPNGDVTITSGDTTNEWVLTVSAEHKRLALHALRQQAASAPPESADPDDALLVALADRFAGGENPYEAIQKLFAASTARRTQPLVSREAAQTVRHTE